MPEIRPSADLRNNYTEISDYCHTTGNPVFITRNGRSDLVVLSSEEYDRTFAGVQDFYSFEKGISVRLTEEKLIALIGKSFADIAEGHTSSMSEGMNEARRRLADV